MKIKVSVDNYIRAVREGAIIPAEADHLLEKYDPADTAYSYRHLLVEDCQCFLKPKPTKEKAALLWLRSVSNIPHEVLP